MTEAKAEPIDPYEVRTRLSEHYRNVISAQDAVSRVANAVWARRFYAPDGRASQLGYTPEQLTSSRNQHRPPDVGDVLDALALVEHATTGLHNDTRHLMEAARALGVSWAEIGEALGYPDDSAKQSAESALKRLANRAPSTRVPRLRPRAGASPAPATKGTPDAQR